MDVRDLSKPIARLLSWRLHPWLIRAGGRVHLALLRRFPGARIVGSDTLILTTRGRRSGQPRSTPVYFVRRGDRLYVAAWFAGRDIPPNWYLNLVADPHVNVSGQAACDSYLARELSEEEAARVWPLLIATYHPFTCYQQRTQRRIPVMELSPVADSEPAPARSFAPSPARRVVASGESPKGARSCRRSRINLRVLLWL